MATQSYKDRIKEERAQARAQRYAEKAAWLRQLTLIAETRRMALQLVKDEIRAKGEKVTDYSVKELRQRAEEMEGPWLVEKARARIASLI